MTGRAGVQARLDHEVVIVGSGFSGIGAAVALRKMGIEDFILLEREKDFGMEAGPGSGSRVLEFHCGAGHGA
jgi:monoamine oxidase